MCNGALGQAVGSPALTRGQVPEVRPSAPECTNPRLKQGGKPIPPAHLHQGLKSVPRGPQAKQGGAPCCAAGRCQGCTGPGFKPVRSAPLHQGRGAHPGSFPGSTALGCALCRPEGNYRGLGSHPHLPGEAWRWVKHLGGPSPFLQGEHTCAPAGPFRAEPELAKQSTRQVWGLPWGIHGDSFLFQGSAGRGGLSKGAETGLWAVAVTPSEPFGDGRVLLIPEANCR